ncbi:MAG: PAS domain S-box protein, partial [Bacteroidota bacterium]
MNQVSAQIASHTPSPTRDAVAGSLSRLARLAAREVGVKRGAILVQQPEGWATYAATPDQHAWAAAAQPTAQRALAATEPVVHDLVEDVPCMLVSFPGGVLAIETTEAATEPALLEEYATLAADVLALQREQESLLTTQVFVDATHRMVQLGYWSYDVATGNNEWSDETFRVYGLEPAPTAPSFSDLLARFYAPEHAEELAQCVQDAIAHQRPYQVVLPAKRVDGTTAWLEACGAAWLNADGEVSQLVGTVQDVTAFKEAETALQATEDQLRLYREQTHTPLITWDTQGRIIGWNPAAERLFGHTPAEALGAPVDILVAESARAPIADLTEQLVGGADTLRSINEHVTKDGRVITCEWFNTPLLDDAGAITAVLSSCTDVTERERNRRQLRRQESQLREAQQVAGIGSFEWDFRRDVFDYSEQFGVIYGLDPTTYDGSVRTIIDAYIHPEDRSLVEESIQAAIDQGVP